MRAPFVSEWLVLLPFCRQLNRTAAVNNRHLFRSESSEKETVTTVQSWKLRKREKCLIYFYAKLIKTMQTQKEHSDFCKILSLMGHRMYQLMLESVVSLWINNSTCRDKKPRNSVLKRPTVCVFWSRSVPDGYAHGKNTETCSNDAASSCSLFADVWLF